MQRLVILKNFNGAMEILTALNFNAVTRALETEWKSVPSKYVDALKEISDLLDPKYLQQQQQQQQQHFFQTSFLLCNCVSLLSFIFEITFYFFRNNYSRYRELLKQITAPGIPFVALFLRDIAHEGSILTFLQTRQSKRKPKERKRKRECVSERVRDYL
jgi:cell division protein FtsB